MGKEAGSAYTFACTLSLADHYIKKSFKVSPLQEDHDIFILWWWTLQHSIRYLYSAAEADIVVGVTALGLTPMREQAKLRLRLC